MRILDDREGIFGTEWKAEETEPNVSPLAALERIAETRSGVPADRLGEDLVLRHCLARWAYLGKVRISERRDFEELQIAVIAGRLPRNPHPQVPAEATELRILLENAAPWRTTAFRTLDSWPRIWQLASLAVGMLVAILAAAGVVSSGVALFAGFLALSALCFGNYAAHRRHGVNWFIGHRASMLGTWGCLAIALAVGVNLLFA